MKTLEMNGLTKTFRSGGHRIRAVTGFSETIVQGQIVAIVGESGSGKSTIARMVMGLERPNSGEVLLHDGAATRQPGLCDVQMVFQDPFASLNPVHRVKTHLERPIKKLRSDIHGSEAIRTEVERLLTVVELMPHDLYSTRFPASLSGGQRQRVAIARALAPRPSFLVADEPTSMLDVSIRYEILQLLKRLRASGVGILLITHDLKSVEAIADRVCVLRRGLCVERGDVRDVLTKPRHPYTRLLCASVPDPEGHFLDDDPLHTPAQVLEA